MKTPVTSRQAQRAVAYVLTLLMFAETMEDVRTIYDDVFKKFSLRDDPFTGCPVCTWDYYRLKDSKNQQEFINKYGYFDPSK